jgi:hypothetical protein
MKDLLDRPKPTFMENKKTDQTLMLSKVSEKNTRYDITNPPRWVEAGHDDDFDSGNWCEVHTGYTKKTLQDSIRMYEKRGWIMR